MKILKILLITCILALTFITGLLSSYLVNSAYINKESPFLIDFGNTNKQPSDWIKSENIQVYSDRVVIKIDNALLSSYEATGSMLPILGEKTNGIKIAPESAEQISIGDIISFERDDKLIVHRVIDKGKDSHGFWFVTKGDNNQETDGKVYFSQVKYVTIALVY